MTKPAKRNPLVSRLNPPCGRLACGPGWSRTRENSLRLRDVELWLVWKGRGWMRDAAGREFLLLPGFCALMRPGGIYDAGHDEGNPLGIAYIHFDAVPGVRLADWPEFFQVDDLDFYNAATRRLVQLHAADPGTAAALLDGLLRDLLRLPPLSAAAGGGSGGGPAPAHRRHRHAVSRLVAALHASPDRLPDVAAMARQLHLSRAHFSRVFKAVTQTSPIDFLLEMRLSRARHLLTETDLSVGEIAERLDYADIFFFSRQFKKKTGLSPLQYRRRTGRD
ncbi:MAG TPA: AraC family transcriptional regulator [Candidatus Methylacidiphilales bacterium]